ncbi:hypothetical protein D9758_003455 [Tetrapyrgos nigripes]|uniref:Flavin-containing monooxygenase n=1 Tax=Tetrapyrgos nigripes TaxID=182062 RepID=A0A8H5GVK2_9AGAR|nr:hypothetical protein D9758_003455 [Tetrapyrgos nigripes]
MSFKLPTLDHLQAKVPPGTDAKEVASEWFKTFVSHVEAGNVDGVVGLFHPEAFWRDTLAMTWDFRTFVGTPKIKEFLTARLKSVKLNALKLKDDSLGPTLQQPMPDLAWIQLFFDFQVGDIGIASGICRLVPTANGEWKAIIMYTNLEDLQGYPEKTGFLRNDKPNHGLWLAEREKEARFEDADPDVLVIGGGHNGLEISARLKMLGISSLIVEKNDRIGDNWRNRYRALCLHDPVWYDHMPYLSFPPNWPVYSPAAKMANWLENYVEAMELNVWTKATVTNASRDESANRWTIHINFPDGQERVFKKVKHVVFATGFGSGKPEIPSYPDLDKFKGPILHSSQHKLATDHIGKKIVVIGSCTSAHDIASDYYYHGIDVTMYQRDSTYVMTTKNGWDVLMGGVYSEDGPPTHVADMLNASFPNAFMRNGLAQRQAAAIAELDKPILDALKKVGFRLNMGIDGTGFGLLAWNKAGGYYLDVGGSQLVADRKIKLKNDSKLARFTETGLVFEDGSELPADVIGLVCGEEITKRVKPIWGLDSEAEIRGCWRDLGVPGLWFMAGNFALSRFYSKHIALQIKAMEEGKFGPRYSLE